MKRKRADCINRSSLVDQRESDWDRCQDGFDRSIISQAQKSSSTKTLSSSNKKSKSNKTKLLSFEKLASQDDNIDITWSSSDDDSCSDIRPLLFESPDASPELKKSIRHSINKPVIKDDTSKTYGHVLATKQLTSVSSQSQNSEASEVLISDYESGSDDDDDEIRDHSTQQTSESYSISSTSSSLPSNSLPSSVDNKNVSPKKGSNLLNLLKQQMKSPQSTEENNPLDSAKKKSKFLRGGLADRLQKLISRERSSIAMWKHCVLDLKNNASTTAVTVNVLKVDSHHGLYICECLDISSGDESEQRMLHVLFSTSTARQWHIAQGSIITIHPPWQRLNLPAYSEPILLCTHYCQLVGQDSEAGIQAHTSTYHTTRRKMSFDALPCVEPSTVRPVLEEVTIQEVGPFDEEDQASDSILDSIADSSGHSIRGMCIRATVQRVCCYNIQQNEQLNKIVKTNQGWFLLLQDIRGVFCEMQLPDGCQGNNTWKEYFDGEGKTFIFKGAKVSQRTNRSRSVRLFSMLDSMWPPSDAILPTGFNSQSESSQQTLSLPAPSFCYTLTIESQHDILKISNKQHTIYKPSTVCKLKDINNGTTRNSIYAKVCYVTPASTDNVFNRIYITDPSLQESIKGKLQVDSSECEAGDLTCFTYRCLLLEPSCVVETKLTTSHVFLFKDIFVENDGSLHADNYSRILQVDEPQVCEELKSMGVHLHPLQVNSNQLDLVSVQGKIVGVEESSAYQWPVCELCGCDKLHVVSSLNDQFYCEVCQKDIVSTAMRMFLEVYIECISAENAQVKVQLQQSSIESILPPITPQIKLQGFDLQSIMGKNIGPINVIVRKASKSSKQFVVEEIEV